jgi:uncharacterized protein
LGPYAGAAAARSPAIICSPSYKGVLYTDINGETIQVSVGETLAPQVIEEPSQPLGEVSDFIVKVWERCNLGCDYCYMYEGPDKTFLGRPRSMSEETFDQFAAQVGAYAGDHGKKDVFVIFHGGEPTLQKPEFFDRASQAVEGSMLSDGRVHLSVQTNGTRLTPEHLDVFAAHNVKLGVSLDGGRVANDRHRLLRQGQSTFADTMNGLQLINSNEDYRKLFTGILAVIDLENDPVATYHELCDALKHGAPEDVDLAKLSIDFLPPLGNWTYLPPGRNADASLTPYADWLIQVYNQWTDEIAQGKPTPHIRIFEEIMRRHVTNGRGAIQEMFGAEGRYPGNMVIETDGSIHLLDALKTTGPSITELGLNVFDHDFTEAEVKMREIARRLGIMTLPQECQVCPVKTVCSGGYYPHRYKKDGDPLFGQLPVYHPDWLKLIGYITRE